MGLDYQLLLAEVRKLRKELASQIDGLHQPFDKLASTAITTTPPPPTVQLPTAYHDDSITVGPGTPVVADNWGGFFDEGDDSIEQRCAASIVADNWGGLFEQPAHIPELALSAIDASFAGLAPTDQIRIESALTFPDPDAPAPSSALVTPVPSWERTEADLSTEQQRIEEFAAMLCWEKVTAIREIGIWRKQLDSSAPAPTLPPPASPRVILGSIPHVDVDRPDEQSYWRYADPRYFVLDAAMGSACAAAADSAIYLGHDDCLFRDGQPLLSGEIISFEYANAFLSKLSVSVATCIDPTMPTTVRPASISIHAQVVFDKMLRRYTIDIYPPHSNGDALFGVVPVIQEAPEVFEEMAKRNSEILWPPPMHISNMLFTASVPLAQSLVDKSIQSCFSPPSRRSWDAVSYRQPWPPPMQFEIQSDGVQLRPTPWPSFIARRVGMLVVNRDCTWFKVHWPLPACLCGTLLLSMSMVGCALIHELVQRKCGGNCRCSLLEVTEQQSRVTGGKAMDHWQAKQDLLPQFLSSDPSCTELLKILLCYFELLCSNLGGAWNQSVSLRFVIGMQLLMLLDSGDFAEKENLFFLETSALQARNVESAFQTVLTEIIIQIRCLVENEMAVVWTSFALWFSSHQFVAYYSHMIFMPCIALNPLSCFSIVLISEMQSVSYLVHPLYIFRNRTVLQKHHLFSPDALVRSHLISFQQILIWAWSSRISILIAQVDWVRWRSRNSDLGARNSVVICWIPGAAMTYLAISECIASVSKVCSSCFVAVASIQTDSWCEALQKATQHDHGDTMEATHILSTWLGCNFTSMPLLTKQLADPGFPSKPSAAKGTEPFSHAKTTLLGSMQFLHVPWDPGGTMHQLGGKPNFKKGRMLGIIHAMGRYQATGQVAYWAMSTAYAIEEQYYKRAPRESSRGHRTMRTNRLSSLSSFPFSLLFIFPISLCTRFPTSRAF